MLYEVITAEGQGEKAYPAKAIEIVVPSSAGGSTDAMARIFAQVAKKHLEGSEFVIVNKPGSGGQQGFEYIAAAKPDGYTIGTVFVITSYSIHYTKLYDERELTKNTRDWKQIFDYGPAGSGQLRPQWPARQPSLRPAVQAYYRACEPLAYRRITSYNVCYTKLLRPAPVAAGL